MGIREIQVRRIIEKIVKHYLFHGRYPTFQTITHHFGQWLREHIPGAPTLNPLKVFRKEKSDSQRYNDNIDMLHTDLSDAYEATIEQTNRIMSNFNYIDTERGKLIHDLATINRKIDELLLISDHADYRHFEGRVITFEDMNYINTAETTAHADIQNREVTLAENIKASNRVIVNGAMARFQVLQPATKHEALQSINYAFDDNLNTAWWHVVKTHDLGYNNEGQIRAGVMKAELSILFEQDEEFNHIEYIPHHGRPVDIKMEITHDGASYVPINQKAAVDRVTGNRSWSFPIIKARGIKFIFEKKEYDERSAGVYQYYFGAKSINIFKRNYLSEGILYTNPIEFDQNIKILSMYANNEIPFNTDISYEIALWNPEKKMNELIWYPISSMDDTQPKFAKVIEFNTKHVRRVETSKAEATGEIKNGMRVFRLVKQNGDGLISEVTIDRDKGETEETFDVIENPKLFRGINQWRRERTYVPFKGDIPINSKWEEEHQNRPELIQTDYQPIKNTLNLRRQHGGAQDNFYRFTTCVYSDDPRIVPLSISVIRTMSSGVKRRLGTYSVYVNKKRLIPVNDEVTMEFIKGWNEIQILYHWGNMQERKDTPEKDLPSETYLGKFNFARETRVRADLEHMRYVDTHSLYHNISPNNRDYFSIHERQVVLNYLPKNCLFQLVYEANRDMDDHNIVVLRARLERDIDVPHITPKINSIRLRAT